MLQTHHYIALYCLVESITKSCVYHRLHINTLIFLCFCVSSSFLWFITLLFDNSAPATALFSSYSLCSFSVGGMTGGSGNRVGQTSQLLTLLWSFSSLPRPQKLCVATQQLSLSLLGLFQKCNLGSKFGKFCGYLFLILHRLGSLFCYSRFGLFSSLILLFKSFCLSFCLFSFLIQLQSILNLFQLFLDFHCLFFSLLQTFYQLFFFIVYYFLFLFCYFFLFFLFFNCTLSNCSNVSLAYPEHSSIVFHQYQAFFFTCIVLGIPYTKSTY